VPQAAIDKHLSVIGNPSAMEAALAWYRARGERQPIGRTKVPTLFIWGDADDTVGRISAEGTSEFIRRLSFRRPARRRTLCGGPGAGAGQRVAAGTPRPPPRLIVLVKVSSADRAGFARRLRRSARTAVPEGRLGSSASSHLPLAASRVTIVSQSRLTRVAVNSACN
jgi:hypothetical protein